MFERVTGDIPIEKFPYGKPEADWTEWSRRFERAVQAATNAFGRDRLEELCLIWIALKLPEETQPIYSKCVYKDRDWSKLRAELEEGLEDPKIRRDWVRNQHAFKRPVEMPLQVYRAKVIGYVNKYSPAIVHDTKAYNTELFNRFNHGLPNEWRDYIEESIPYGKETIDTAYNQALKYEHKIANKKVDFTGAAMTDSEKNDFKKMQLDMAEVQSKLERQEAEKAKWRDRYESRRSRGTDRRSDRRRDERSQSKQGARQAKDGQKVTYGRDRRGGASSSRSGSGDKPKGRGFRDSPHHSKSRSSSGRSGSSFGSRSSRDRDSDNLRAIETADEDSEYDEKKALKLAAALLEAHAKKKKKSKDKPRDKPKDKPKSRSKND